MVLGVNQEPGNVAQVRHFMRSRKLGFPTVIDPGNISQRWGVFTFPTSFLIDREGKVRASYRGVASPGRLRRDIEDLLGPSV